MIAAPATRTLGAPLIASVEVVVTGLSVAGAFGVARLIFQDWQLAGVSAAVVMIAVFLTFALSGPLAPTRWG